MLILPIDSELLEILIFGTDCGTNVYAIFRFEPLHNLSVGISHLLQKFNWTVLEEAVRQTSAFKFKTRLSNKLKAVKAFVLFKSN